MKKVRKSTSLRTTTTIKNRTLKSKKLMNKWLMRKTKSSIELKKKRAKMTQLKERSRKTSA